jgi:hypothetical protein
MNANNNAKILEHLSHFCDLQNYEIAIRQYTIIIKTAADEIENYPGRK